MVALTGSIAVMNAVNPANSATAVGSSSGAMSSSQPQMIWLKINEFQMLLGLGVSSAQFHESIYQIVEATSAFNFLFDFIDFGLFSSIKDTIEKRIW
jgi:hypothetical protein